MLECGVCRAQFAPATNRGKKPSRCPDCYAHDRRATRPKKKKQPRLPTYVCGRCNRVKKYRSKERTVCGECSRTLRKQARVFKCGDCSTEVRDGRVGFCMGCRLANKARNSRAYNARRRREDPFYLLMGRMRSRLRPVRTALKFRSKLPSDLEKALGYTADDLRVHIERGFSSGMTWDDIFSGRIHIDHKRPVSSFDWADEARFDVNIRDCWALSNLQPLWAIDNLRKGAAWANEVAFI